MADYWKSQDRKYCDFCKCWIADNKPSVQFHESGKKHKENVAKRLSQISKQSIIDQKKREEDNADFKKMEQDALQAYMKDIDRGGDYSTQQLKNKYDIPQPTDIPTVPLPPAPSSLPPSHPKPSTSSKPPRPSKPTYSEPIGPQKRPSGGALGQWETVEEPQLPDLDLPDCHYVELQVPVLQPDYYPELKLKEKTVSSLKDDSFVKKEEAGGEGGMPAFKKRKVNRGNARTRLDTD
uniref:WW domain-binding protein 4 n=1 Tax=Cacopsylla melanoneura TaxID=428564 RepID=A0A8D8WQM7_9HEMI